MSRWKLFISTTAVALTLFATLSLASASPAQAATWRAKMRHARHDLHHAKVHLRQVRSVYRQARAASRVAALSSGSTTASPAAVPGITASPMPAATASPLPSPSPSAGPATVSEQISPAPSLGQLKRAVLKAQKRVHRIKVRIRTIRHELKLEWAARTHHWWPLLHDAAKRYHVSAGQMYRTMSMESGGNPAIVGGGMFYGLFQYCKQAWNGSWNPQRHHSIFDGRAQIYATAYAFSRGWGARMWPNTY